MGWMSRCAWGTGVLVLAGLASPEVAMAEPCKLPSFVMPVTMQGLRASVPVTVNSKQTTFWLDSGAWFSTMSLAKAQELGLPLSDLPPGFTMSGIGGSFQPQVGRIKDFAINGSALHNIEFVVGGSDAGAGLIGRNLLANFDTEFDIGHGEVSLIRPKGDCTHVNMAYWSKDRQPFTVKLLRGSGDDKIKDFRIPILLNGKEVDAAIDSGAQTLISRAAAERAGIDLNGPDVEPINRLSGFGRHFLKGWSVRLKSISIGDESILNPRLSVIDGPIVDGADAPDMLLGIGFLLSHHLYVSRAQHLIYFTYNGGMPFIDDRAEDHLAAEGSAQAMAIPSGHYVVKPLDTAKAPTSAAEFATRAALMMTQGSPAQAAQDYSQAIALAPTNADYYRQRAIANRDAGDRNAALSDLRKAAELKPDDAATMLQLAYAYHVHDDADEAWSAAQKARSLVAPQSLQMPALADLYVELGHAADAVPLYEPVIRAHREDSNLGFLYNGRCWSSALANIATDDALRDCNRAMKLTDNSPGVRDSLALELYRQGKFAEALDNYDKVLAADPKEAWSLYMRGMTQTALGQAAKGAADRKAAIAMQPSVLKRAEAYGLMPKPEDAS